MKNNEFFYKLALVLDDFDKEELENSFFSQQTWVDRSKEMEHKLEFWKTKFLDAFSDILEFFKNKKDLEEHSECEDGNGRKLMVNRDPAEDMGEHDIRYSMQYVDEDELDVEFGVFVYHERDTIIFGYGTPKHGCLFGALIQRMNLYVGELVQGVPYAVGWNAKIDSESIARRVDYIGQSQQEGKSQLSRKQNSNDNKNARFVFTRNSKIGESCKIQYGCMYKSGDVFVGGAIKKKDNDMIPRGEGFCYFAKERCFYEGLFMDYWKVQNGRWKALDGSTYVATYENNDKKNDTVWNMKVPECVHHDKCKSFLEKSKHADAMFEELMRECTVEDKMTKSQKTRKNKMKRWQKKKEEEERMSGLMYSEQVSKECMICLEEKDTGKKCPYGHVVCHACFLTFSIQNGFDGTCSVFNKCTGVLEDM